MRHRPRIIIGISSNFHARETVESGIRALRQLFPDLRFSSLKTTAPLQGTGPDYINAVAVAETELPPDAVVIALKSMEQAAGRRLNHRTSICLDLDLMDYGGMAIPALRLPRTAQLKLDFNQEALTELNS